MRSQKTFFEGSRHGPAGASRLALVAPTEPRQRWAGKGERVPPLVGGAATGADDTRLSIVGWATTETSASGS